VGRPSTSMQFRPSSCWPCCRVPLMTTTAI
jgi:hypothetical protein